jgi:hypothetical protein
MKKSSKNTKSREIQDVLLQQIAEKAEEIRLLSEEKDVLERMLLKTRQQDELLKRADVTRKNSVNRVLVESSVIQSLKATGQPVPVRSLYTDARLMVPTLRENTFRSYLHRMKARGLVISAGQRRWQISEISKVERLSPKSQPVGRNSAA